MHYAEQSYDFKVSLNVIFILRALVWHVYYCIGFCSIGKPRAENTRNSMHLCFSLYFYGMLMADSDPLSVF